MKLGDTPYEMQKNYSEIVKKSRKVGKVFTILGGLSSLASLYLLVQVINNDVGVKAEIAKLILIGLMITCPIFGAIAGRWYYYAFRRMAYWLECLSTGGSGDDLPGFLLVFMVFGGLGTMIAYVVCFAVFFSLGMYIGLYDWIKIHMDAKKYGLKVQ